jgi:hypothetical protein
LNPRQLAWEARTLPLSYARSLSFSNTYDFGSDHQRARYYYAASPVGVQLCCRTLEVFQLDGVIPPMHAV